MKMDGFIGSHYLGKEEMDACNEVMASKSLFRYDGIQLLRKTEQFENSLKSFLNAEYVLACSSGTAALKLCCVALGIGPGDEVLLPPFTFISSAGAILSCGATPNFVDIGKDMNIDAETIEKSITVKTKAIMVVHIQGMPCDMEHIMEIAKKHNLYIIEDCAQSFGAIEKGKAVGTWGDAAAFSLQANKIITCGEGGVFCCKETEHYENAKRYHDNGGSRYGDNYPVWNLPECSFGENFKITEIQSAIALAQLNKFQTIKQRQQYIYKCFSDNLNAPMRIGRAASDYVPISICIYFNGTEKCEQFIYKCNQYGIPYDTYCDKLLISYTTFQKNSTWHTNFKPYPDDYQFNSCPNAEVYMESTAWLPICPTLNEEEIDNIIKITNQVYLELTGGLI